MSTFVGRRQEMRLLVGLLEADGPAAALVIGQAGSGKSRLLAQASSGVAQRRAFSVVGYESEQQVPLAAAAGLLRDISGSSSDGAELEGLVLGRASARPGPLEPLRVFELTRRVLRSVGRAALVVDDLQWVDDLSLSLCHYLARAAFESRQQLVVVAATRPAGRGHELFAGLPAEHVTRIDLMPLTRDEGVALVRLLDPRVEPDRAVALWRHAGGIPFWLEALVLHGGVDDGLQQLLTRRLRGAGRDAAKLLGALALAERPMSIARVAEFLDRPLEPLEAALQLLCDRGLAEESNGEARPAHDLIRDMARAELPSELRRRLHERMAELLEREAGDDLAPLAQALEHRRAAGTSAVGLAGRMARSAQRRLLRLEGLADLALVADQADQLSSSTVALNADLASLAGELGAHQEALTRWSLVAERAREQGLRAAASLEASRAAYELGRTDEARELLARSRELAADDELMKLEQLTHEAAILLWREGRLAEGRSLARQVAATACQWTDIEAPSGISPGRVQRAYLAALRLEYEAAMQEGDPRMLIRAAETWESVARNVGSEEALAAGLAVGVALRQSGRIRLAISRFRRIWIEADRAVLPLLTVDAGFWLARSHALIGELSEAEQVAIEASAVARRVGDFPRARHSLARVLAWIWFESGRYGDAIVRLDQQAAQGDDHQRLLLHADRAVWDARLRGAAAAETVRAELVAADKCAAAAVCPRCSGEMLLLAAEALVRIGDHKGARATWSRLDRASSRDVVEQLAADHVTALLPLDGDRRHAALAEVLARAVATPYRLLTLWIRLDLARAQKNATDATTTLGEVISEAEQLGASTVRDLAAQALRRLGVRTWRRGRTGLPLTSRELEVARLAASGARNREIAQGLFLSPKTVERHLVNLFRKLGVRNRTELAARLAEPGSRNTGIAR